VALKIQTGDERMKNIALVAHDTKKRIWLSVRFQQRNLISSQPVRNREHWKASD